MRACSTPTATRRCSRRPTRRSSHYDPAFAYEIAHIVRGRPAPDVRPSRGAPARRGRHLLPHRLQRADRAAGEPDDVDVEGILARHLPLLRRAERRRTAPRVQLLASGVAMPWALEAQQLLAEEWGVAADVWSVTSWNELRRDAVAAEEWNLLHPGERAAGAVRHATAGRRGRAGRRGVATTCAPCRTRSRAGCRATTRRSGADGFGFADTRRRAAPLLPHRRRVDRAGGAARSSRRPARSSPRRRARRSTATSCSTWPRPGSAPSAATPDNPRRGLFWPRVAVALTACTAGEGDAARVHDGHAGLGAGRRTVSVTVTGPARRRARRLPRGRDAAGDPGRRRRLARQAPGPASLTPTVAHHDAASVCCDACGPRSPSPTTC